MGEVARRRRRRVEGMNGERDGEIDPVSATQVAEKERTKIRTGVGDSSCREEKTRWGMIARDKPLGESEFANSSARKHARSSVRRLRAAKYSRIFDARGVPPLTTLDGMWRAAARKRYPATCVV